MTGVESALAALSGAPIARYAANVVACDDRWVRSWYQPDAVSFQWATTRKRRTPRRWPAKS